MTHEYIAGFFDGEGTITITKNKIRLSIPQTNYEVLDEIKNFLGFGSIRTEKLRKAHWKQSWTFYNTNSEDGFKLLNLIEPHLIVKKSKAIEAITIYKKYSDTMDSKKLAKVNALKLISDGKSYREVEKLTGVGRQTIVRLTKRSLLG